MKPEWSGLAQRLEPEIRRLADGLAHLDEHLETPGASPAELQQLDHLCQTAVSLALFLRHLAEQAASGEARPDFARASAKIPLAKLHGRLNGTHCDDSAPDIELF